MLLMKKSTIKKEAKPYTNNDAISKVAEPYLLAPSLNKLPAALADFPYSKFKKIADKVPFTQSEWASILHLSERTLQRYSKDNKSFEGIYVDRILQLDKLINLGIETFEDAEAFYKWLKTSKNILGSAIGFEALYHTNGLQEVYNQLQRIQHGIYT